MKHNLSAIILTSTLAFFATLKSSDAQNVDSFGSNGSNVISSLDSSENSPSPYDVNLNSSSSPADGTSSGSTNPLTDISSKANNFDVAYFFEDPGRLVAGVILLLTGLAFFALGFYLLVYLPYRFLRWFFGFGKKDVKTRGKDERIYGDVLHGFGDDRYVVREDITERVRREEFWNRFWGGVVRLIVIGILVLILVFLMGR